ncbi:WD repeat-containing protein 75 [Bulinus truncatus]|nr:WD repeat-containing protein 75 [Bulinus truncatus]
MTLVPSLQAGSQFGKYIFSHDSKFLICCCGNVIKVFNTRNGEFVHDLQGHMKTVTGVALNPSNVLQVFSCGQDGLLISWDYLDGVKLKHYDLHMALNGIISISAEKKSIMMLAQTLELKKNFSVMLWKKNADGEYAKPKVLLENCDGNYNLVSFGCSKDYVVSALKNKLFVHSMKKGVTEIVSDNDKYNKGKVITSVACHPSEYYVATGLESGKIVLWRNFFSNGEPLTTVIHWHALPVTCLDFTPDGSNLLSGGHECVLVKWQTNNTARRDFKPRMGAPLADIVVSPDGNFYATKHNDNVIQLLDINLHILQVYRGMTYNNFCVNEGKNPIPCGLKYDPKWKTIVTNGLLGHLQFYSVSLNRQIFNLDIVGQNYISPENFEKPKFITEVLSSAISEDGDWLATFEMWDDGVFQPELRLKFWSYCTESQTYALNTTVEYPHDKKITSMMFRSMHQSFPDRRPTLVTVGADMCFKLWSLIDNSDIYKRSTCWTCESVGVYHDLAALCADFSKDGSTLVVAFEHLLTIWDPESNVLRATLSNSLQKKQNILSLKFGSGNYCHQLIAATSEHLVSWNLMTLSISWSTALEICVLLRDPASDLMAYISKNKTLCVFRPDSPKPLYIHDEVSAHEVLDAIFVPDGRHERIADVGWPGHSQIYIYNIQQQLITLDLECDKQNQHKVQIAQNLPANTLSTLMAETRRREHKTKVAKETAAKTRPYDDLFISSFLHCNEPISLFCDKYLDSILVKKKSKKMKRDTSENLNKGSSDEDLSSSDSEEELVEQNLAKNGSEVNISKKTSCQISEVQVNEADEDMDQLLSVSSDWVKWCASLTSVAHPMK